MDKQINIIGGGIGGLAFALSLQHADIKFQLYEQTIKPEPIGAGLALWPNATYILDQLGLLDKIQNNSGLITDFTMYTNQGKLLHNINYTNYGYPTICIHRAKLYQILLDQLDKTKLHFAYQLCDISKGINFHTIKFYNGETINSDITIGFDGIHSAVRQHIAPQIKLRHCGYYAYRGISNIHDLEIKKNQSFEYLGSGVRFGAFPIGNNQIYWYVTSSGKFLESSNSISKLQQIINLLTDFPTWIIDIVIKTAENQILAHDIYDLTPFKNWYSDNILVCGDAAHAQSPDIGQGAGMAIEDAYILTKILSNSKNISDSFNKFISLRKPRTQFMQRHARQISQVGQIKNPCLIALRNIMLKNTPNILLNRNLNKMYDYKFTE